LLAIEQYTTAEVQRIEPVVDPADDGEDLRGLRRRSEGKGRKIELGKVGVVQALCTLAWKRVTFSTCKVASATPDLFGRMRRAMTLLPSGTSDRVGS
jgi:hypothetical protein